MLEAPSLSGDLTSEGVALPRVLGTRRRRWPQPWVFVLMPLPFGIFQGYIQTPLPYLLRQMGYSVDRIGSIEAFILLPMTLYFLWSPLVDFWLRRRTWMILFAALG